uniref:Ig-like domain-containing protein n=1 Tax=Cyclopterus lumpus TaxID=8103 RepID=A0A8C3G244_CYCLU
AVPLMLILNNLDPCFFPLFPITGESVKRLQSCYSEFCITLIEGEITAEAGLCVVIPCFFTTGNGFTPQYVVWYKCEPPKGRCGDADVIFHTNENNNNKVQAEFLGRVSLLEPDVSQKNCSIIINELTESDSGKYQVRVNSVNYWGQERSTFSTRATVSVKGMMSYNKLLIPPLTEGQQTTLTCTAPGLCSGSHPEITWTWREAGEKDSYITGNITAVTQGRSSTLTFNPSAEHHGTNVTCKVNFTSNISTDETATLNVACDVLIYFRPILNFTETTGTTIVKEGETLNLTCSVESFPPSLITNRQNNTELFMQRENSACVLKGFSKILNNSGCEVQSGVLTCVCISEGFPLPTIEWPLLKNHTEYSVITTVSNHTVNSTATLTVKDHSGTSIECVSSSGNGEARETINIRKNTLEQKGECSQLKHFSYCRPLFYDVVSIYLSTVTFLYLVKYWTSCQKKIRYCISAFRCGQTFIFCSC